MRVHPSCTLAIVTIGCLFTLVSPASASCTRYNLQNGNTADATQVMADFNCLQGNVESLQGNLQIDNGDIFVTGWMQSQGSASGFAFNDRKNANNLWMWYSTGNTASLWKNFNPAGNVVSIDQNGNVGIGTSSPGGVLDVRYTSGIQCIRTGNANVQWQDVALCWDVGGQTAYIDTYGYSYPVNIMDGSIHVAPGNGNGNVGIDTKTPSYTLHVNGTAYATGAAGALSDARHKKDVTPLADGALATVERLRPVTFLWKQPKDDGMKGTQIGFIAQDVERIIPTAVLTANDAEKTKGLKYNEIVAVLTKAVQELKVSNDATAAENRKLRAANEREMAMIATLQRQINSPGTGHHEAASSGNVLWRVALAFGWY